MKYELPRLLNLYQVIKHTTTDSIQYIMVIHYDNSIYSGFIISDLPNKKPSQLGQEQNTGINQQPTFQISILAVQNGVTIN